MAKGVDALRGNLSEWLRSSPAMPCDALILVCGMRGERGCALCVREFESVEDIHSIARESLSCRAANIFFYLIDLL